MIGRCLLRVQLIIICTPASFLSGYTQPLKHAHCSAMLAIIAIGNLLALALLNVLELSTAAVLWIWPLGLALGWFLVRGLRWRAARTALPKAATYLVIAWVLLLTAPRLPYLLDRIPDAHILGTGDDHGRLAELVSLTKSPRYPVLHPSNQEYLLSHYYAAFYPMVWLKFAAPSLTLKECILLGNLLYHVLFAGALLELAARLFHRQRDALAFLFLMTFFSGLDWVTTLPHLFEHSEHWFRHWFGEWREISAMYTVTWWAVHHAFGMWILLVGYLIVTQARWQARWRKPFVGGLLLISALYASVFVLVALPFVAPRLLWRLGLRLLRNGLWIPLAAIALCPAFLFFGRLTEAAFRLALPRPVPILVYLAGVLVLEVPLLWWLVRKDRRMLGVLVFFVSCLFVGSIGLNNYTMRGILIPTVILYACAAPRLAALRWQKPLALAAISLTAIGVLREAAWLTYRPLESSPLYWRLTNRDMPAFAAKRLQNIGGLDRFNNDEMLSGVPLEAMDFNEVELLRLPRKGWFR